MVLKIGELARLTGTSVPTIRYYEEIGLLPVPNRRNSGRRCYGSEDVKRLTFVRRCRDWALPIKDVKKLVLLIQVRGRSCNEARDMAQRHLEALRAKLVELKALERSFAGLVRSCDATRGNGRSCDAWQEAQR